MICIFEYDRENNEVFLAQRSNGNAGENIFLLLLSDGEKYHYTYLKCLKVLKNATAKKNGCITCDKCFKGFTEKQFKNHQCSIAKNGEFSTIITYPELEKTEFYKKKQIKKYFNSTFLLYV